MIIQNTHKNPLEIIYLKKVKILKVKNKSLVSMDHNKMKLQDLKR